MPTLLPPTESEVCGSGATPNKGAARETFRKWIKAYLNLFGTAGTTQGARAMLGIKQLQAIDATVAANDLTITLQPTNIDFRSTTLGSGAITNVDVPSAITVVVPSGATLGSANAVASRLAVIALNNAGTVELAVINVGGGVVSNEDALLSTTVMNTSSDANNVAYSGTARTSLAFRVVGHIEYTQATAGTYVTAPSLIAGTGSALQPVNATLGYNQTWQDLTASRAKATTYTNTTGKPINVYVTGVSGAVGGQLSFLANGFEVGRSSTSSAASQVLVGGWTVPPGNTYRVNDAAGINTIFLWTEMR